MTQKFSRRGRPPTVTEHEGVFTTRVKGTPFSFKAGDDGRVRRVGENSRGGGDDAVYAREAVDNHRAE